MEKFDIFQDIAERTGGSIYIGVVGPVRTGKSTFIKRFMDLLVLPNIQNRHDKERARDALPQSGAGRTIMTTEPKFVPDEAVEVSILDELKFKVRLVDCVGYSVGGALGYEDEGGPRMVRTPWFDHEIAFQEAAELGTRKVITEHSTLGLVVLTDGSITDIAYENYLEAQQRVIEELQELGKPFVVLLNSVQPTAPKTVELAQSLQEQFDVTVQPIDCLRMTQDDIVNILRDILFEFPIREVGVRFPRWVDELDPDHWLADNFYKAVFETVEQITRLRDVQRAVELLGEYEFVDKARLSSLEPGTGTATIELRAQRELFYQVLGEMTGVDVSGDHHLIGLMKELVVAKKAYDKVADALEDVYTVGYGIVAPSMDDIAFDEPELIRQGHRFGIRLKASAPSIHMIRAGIVTEVTPFVGTERQGEEMVRYLSEEFERDPEHIWKTDFLGKSLHDLVREGIASKLHRMPENAQEKLQETLSKIINEGSGGLICIIL
ncbi:MAG: stage IV sporulation protein A [Limnochordia bacterium]|jgi:stage IV sporulation protein A